VKALDEEDGDITQNVSIVSNTVDTSKKGEYEVHYSVTDSDNNTVEAVQYVFVGDYVNPVDTNYIIKAQNFAVWVESMEGTDAEILKHSNTVVYEIKNKQKVEVNDLAQVKSSGDYAKKVVGDYPIEIGIKGHEETAKIIGKVS
ncbi:immunoglobulin-like domain-containing protein, partial [Erysipelothrix urinaevulpis]|uniref:immunoglobulin-like domain-containing protein n=1 Tax=Erysipelothrix urinaevulpis TaxID=2683717 RepID=UPI0039F12595